MTAGKDLGTPPQAPGLDSALADWLSYLEQLHSSEIDLGLQRLGRVDANLRKGRKPARSDVLVPARGLAGRGAVHDSACILAR